VTSTGQYVIAWDFAKVKKGQMDKYEIKKYEDLVVQDNFRFGDDKEIVCLYMARENVRSLIAFVLDCRTAK
jgi:VID27 C-terminal WD40-like domain